MTVHNMLFMLDNSTFVLRVEDPSIYLQRLCVLSVYGLCEPTPPVVARSVQRQSVYDYCEPILDGTPAVKSAKDRFGVFDTSIHQIYSDKDAKEFLAPYLRGNMYSPYNVEQAAVGDIVTILEGPSAKVVYITGKYLSLEHGDGVLSVVSKKKAHNYLKVLNNYVVVNGFQVPRPLEKIPDDCTVVYIADPTSNQHYYALDTEIEDAVALLLQRNLLHATSANAIAYAKAMIGIKSET